jgi:hypothetical protein
MTYEIRAYAGVGKIDFGMTTAEVRKVLASKVKPSKKGGEIPSDFFEELGIFVDYRPPDICEAVEFAGPASPTFRGRQLLGKPFRSISDWIKDLDPDVVSDEAGLRSNKFGFGIYAPSANKNPDLPVEGVIVFDKEYYKTRNV